MNQLGESLPNFIFAVVNLTFSFLVYGCLKYIQYVVSVAEKFLQEGK